jgi:hypothetical protein
MAYKCADVNSLVEKILYVLDYPDKTRQRVRTAKEYVLKNFKPENYSGKIESRLKQIKGTKIESCHSVQALFGIDFLVEAMQREFERKDAELAAIRNEIGKKDAERDVHIVKLNQALNEREGQIDNLDQALAERNAQIRELNHVANVQDDRIRTRDQLLHNRELELNSLTAELGRITSSRSWKVTMLFRFVSRVLRGDWTAVRASIASRRNGKGNSIVIEEKASANKDVDGKDDAQTP